MTSTFILSAAGVTRYSSVCTSSSSGAGGQRIEGVAVSCSLAGTALPPPPVEGESSDVPVSPSPKRTKKEGFPLAGIIGAAAGGGALLLCALIAMGVVAARRRKQREERRQVRVCAARV